MEHLDVSTLVANVPLVLALALLFGLLVGSFLNVLALRSLKEQSILWPASYCPQCEHALSPLDNIPVLSWVLLQGKCRYCSKPISWQYPVVELITGAVFVAVTWLFLLAPLPYDPNVADLFGGIANGIHHTGAVEQLPLQSRFFLTVGFLFFACTLIAVTVTDFREKLIPHEITYPSMIIGIIFSATVRHDLLGAMAGIGASYIIFDFLAFYGLKIYMKVHGSEEDIDSEESAAEPALALAKQDGNSVSTSADPSQDAQGRLSAENTAPADRPTVETPGPQTISDSKEDDPCQSISVIGSQEAPCGDKQTDAPADDAQTDAQTDVSASDVSTSDVQPSPSESCGAAAVVDLGGAQQESGQPTALGVDTFFEPAGEAVSEGMKTSVEESENDEPFEVMGGGDAVMSAVMSAYLGWQLLVVALCIGFLTGTLMGLALLFVEMKKSNLLHESFKRGGKFAVIAGAAMGVFMASLLTFVHSGAEGEVQTDFWMAAQPVVVMSIVGAIGGALLGMVSVGTQVSKPFPFGPALAIGGFIAMFLIPWWLPFY